MNVTVQERVCLRCNGHHWLRRDLPVGHPEFGNLERCPDCNPASPASRWESLSSLTAAQRQLQLDDIELAGRPGTTLMVQACRLFLGQPTGILTIHGGPGNGKSMALYATVNELQLAGVEAVATTGLRALEYMRSAFNGGSQGSSDDAFARLDSLCTIRVLALDEFDKVQDTPWARSVLGDLIRRRHDLGIEQAVGTLITMNSNPDAQPEWITSRLLDGRNRLVRNADSDIRPALKA